MRTTLIALCLLAACGGSSTSPQTGQTPPDMGAPQQCSASVPDGFCDPPQNDLEETMVCTAGTCEPTWPGKCDTEHPSGSCYDPKYPQHIPARFGLTCAGGVCEPVRIPGYGG